MSSGDETDTRCTCHDAREAANEAIRRYVVGRTSWPPEALAELDRLRTQWRAAVARDTAAAG